MVAKSIRTIGFLVLTAAVCRLGDALPLATAKFPGKQGNITFTPTNGFGTYVTGTLTNLTCNNPIGNLLPANPFVGNSSVPCYVGMTIHNLANGQRNSGVESRQFNWDQIFGNTGNGSINQGGNNCNNIGALFNPLKMYTNALGFLGNMEVFNGTGRFYAGPFNFTVDQSVANPFSVLNLPLVLWKDAINSTLQLANLYNPARILSCAYIQMTQM